MIGERRQARRRGETSDELVARVMREQEGLHPSPVYSDRSRRRLKHYLVAIMPISFALAFLAGWAFDWLLLEVLGSGVGLVLTLAYLGYVVISERDDGRVAAETQQMLRERSAREAQDRPEP